MRVSRRQTLSLLGSAACAAAASSLLSACASMGSRGGGLRTACLLPLSGRAASIGQSMAQSIQLAQPAGIANGSVFILDTMGSPQGAAAAATTAAGNGAQLILGPLFAAELPPVIAASGGQTPIVAFTNDPSMLGRGGFIFGITPSQSVSATLLYAATLGSRRIAIVTRPSPWADGAISAAQAGAAQSGVEIIAVLNRDAGAPASLIKALKAQSGGTLPDAVLLPDGQDAIDEFAPDLAKEGIQLLGTIQWSGLDMTAAPAMNGAIFSAPDPAGFGAFAAAYMKTYGAEPGLLAGLAYDAAMMAGAVGQTGSSPRDTILASVGFSGVTGNFRFNADGSCLRRLAILKAGPAGIQVLAPVSAA